MKPKQPDPIHAEAERLALLSATERDENLQVHWRIAADPQLSPVTRAYARMVAETLESHLRRLAKDKKNSL